MENIDLIDEQRTLTVLLVEDDSEDAEIIGETLLRANMSGTARIRLERAVRLGEALTRLNERRPDILLLDLSLPDSRGIETVRTVRQAAPDIPIVVLSGIDNEAIALEAVRNGAQDYLFKSHVGFKMLYRVIRYAIERTQTDREIRKLSDNVETKVRERTSELQNVNRHLESEIRERLKAEERLKNSERQLAMAQQIARVGSWEWDIAKDIVTWSDEMYRLFGLERSEFNGTYEGVMRAIHPDDREAVHRAVSESYTTGRPFDLMHRVLSPSGDMRFIHTRAEVLVDAAGQALRLMGTAQDVTQQRENEASLRQANASLLLLQKVAAAANDSDDLADAASIALEQVCAITDWPVGHVFVLDRPGGVLRTIGVWHMDNPGRYEEFRTASEGCQFASGEGLPGRVLASAHPETALDLRSALSAKRSETATLCGIAGAVAFPIQIRTEVVGVLEFFDRNPIDPDETVWDVMKQVGLQLGRVLERRRHGERTIESDPDGSRPEAGADVSRRILQALEGVGPFLKDDDKDLRRHATQLRKAALDFASRLQRATDADRLPRRKADAPEAEKV